MTNLNYGQLQDVNVKDFFVNYYECPHIKLRSHANEFYKFRYSKELHQFDLYFKNVEGIAIFKSKQIKFETID